MDPNVDLCQLEPKLTWGEDPVQPLPLGFDKMALGVKMVEEKLVTRLQAEAAKGPKRPRMEAAPRREQQASRPPLRVGMMERDIRYSNSESVTDGEWYRRGGYGGRGGCGGRGGGELGGGRERRRGFF
jgi:hypothetical protein